MEKTCFSLPYVGYRDLSSEEIVALRNAIRARLLRHVVIPILAMALFFGMLILMSAFEGVTGWFTVVAVVLAVAMICWDSNRRYRIALRNALHDRSVDLYSGYMPGYVVLEGDKPPREYKRGRVFEANLAVDQLLGSFLDQRPDIEQSIEVFPTSNLIYRVNGKVLTKPIAANPVVGDEVTPPGQRPSE